jgi:hypothetical protein
MNVQTTAEVQYLRTQLDAAAVKTATLAAENRRLRRLTANGKRGRLLARTLADARQICGWRWAGFSVSRRAALSYGMSRRRWAWAVALLEKARVVKPDAKYLDDAFELDELDDALQALDRAAKVIGEAGLLSLTMRLPRDGRARRKRSQ